MFTMASRRREVWEPSSFADTGKTWRAACHTEPADVPRSDCRLLRMTENSAAAEALYRRGARCFHHQPNQETSDQLP